MDGLSAKKLARNIDLPIDRLITELNEIGIVIENEDDLITGAQQLMLLQHLRTLKANSGTKTDFSVNDVKKAKELRELNQLLTQAMAERKIQALIKDDNLETVIDAVLDHTTQTDQQLVAAAILGRLAAVARGRESVVFDRADEVFTEEPVSIESLEDGDAKQYAAQVLTHVSDSWVTEYTYRESLLIDSADNARRELLTVCLVREGAIADWLGAITQHADVLRYISNLDTKLKRIRRIFSVMSEIADRWRGDVGSDFGDQLENCLTAFTPKKFGDLDEEVLFTTIDYLLSILVRIIELRFSVALHASTYAVMEAGKRILGAGLWGRFIDKSSAMPNIRIALLEAALVLARQNRSDKQIMAVLLTSYTSRPQVAAAIKRHFQDARDLDPDVADWWRSAGEVSETQRHVEHKVGNTEDSQIGALLIEVESNREAMDKVGRAVVPLLEISEPVLASTVKKAVDGYKEIEQTARRLARMRKLTKTDLKGERLEYNPLEHEMLGGHKTGIRRVRVVRDGIMKEFAGKIKTLVKPWVEPEEQ